MSTTVLTLVRVDFDSMENRDPLVKKVVASFAEGEGKTAYAKLGEFVLALPPEPFYLGWDYKVYPCWEVKKLEAQ